jgi:hypothetical protein
VSDRLCRGGRPDATGRRSIPASSDAGIDAFTVTIGYRD